MNNGEKKTLFILLDDFCREKRNKGDCEEVSCKNCPFQDVKQQVRKTIEFNEWHDHSDEEW